MQKNKFPLPEKAERDHNKTPPFLRKVLANNVGELYI